MVRCNNPISACFSVSERVRFVFVGILGHQARIRELLKGEQARFA